MTILYYYRFASSIRHTMFHDQFINANIISNALPLLSNFTNAYFLLLVPVLQIEMLKLVFSSFYFDWKNQAYLRFSFLPLLLLG